jgi:DNA-directed RNA polymerase specialized sigma subunit
MDYKKVIETWLRDYNEINIQLESYKMLYEEIELHVKNGDPVQYDQDKLSGTNKFNSQVENEAIQLATLKTTINHLENRRLVVDQGVKQLEDKERRIIELRYMKLNRWERQLTWLQISCEMKYDVSWLRELRNRAINSLVEIMFGEIQAKNPLNTSDIVNK